MREEKDPLDRVTLVRKAFRHVAVRDAVLKPLFDVDLGDGMSKYDLDRAIIRALARTRQLWRQRISELRALDPNEGPSWRALDPNMCRNVALSATFLGNCPSFGVVTNSRYRVCNKPMICPFCYGRRQVLEAYMKMERFLYHTSDAKEKPDPDAGHLVAWLAAKRGYCNSQHDFEPNAVQAHWCPALKAALKFRARREFDGCGAHHGVVLARVQPEANQIRVDRGGLFFTHTIPTREQLFLKETDFFKVYERPMKKDLAEAVGQVMKYPVGMLRSKDVVMVAAILEGMRYAHFLNSFGKFPKRPRIKRED